MLFRKKRCQIALNNDLIIDKVVINRTNHTKSWELWSINT